MEETDNADVDILINYLLLNTHNFIYINVYLQNIFFFKSVVESVTA